MLGGRPRRGFALVDMEAAHFATLRVGWGADLRHGINVHSDVFPVYGIAGNVHKEHKQLIFKEISKSEQIGVLICTPTTHGSVNPRTI